MPLATGSLPETKAKSSKSRQIPVSSTILLYSICVKGDHNFEIFYLQDSISQMTKIGVEALRGESDQYAASDLEWNTRNERHLNAIKMIY